jgi:hypothetical protein
VCELPAQAVVFSLFVNKYAKFHLERHLKCKVLIGAIITTQEEYYAVRMSSIRTRDQHPETKTKPMSLMEIEI